MGTERLRWMLAAKVNCVVDSGDHLDDFQKSASWSLVAVFILASLRFAWSLGISYQFALSLCQYSQFRVSACEFN
jgi:hypothetical protein